MLRIDAITEAAPFTPNAQPIMPCCSLRSSERPVGNGMPIANASGAIVAIVTTMRSGSDHASVDCSTTGSSSACSNSSTTTAKPARIAPRWPRPFLPAHDEPRPENSKKLHSPTLSE